MPKTISKIEELGLVSDVMKLYFRGYGARKISAWIEENHGIYINPYTIQGFLRKHRYDKFLTRESKEKVSKELEKLNIDITREIATLYKEMREHFERLKKMNPNNPQLVKVADHLIKNLKVMAKITGDLKEVRTEVNVLNLAPKINAMIQKYREEGIFYCKNCGSTDIGIKKLRLQRV